MKRCLSVLMAAPLVFCCFTAFAEEDSAALGFELIVNEFIAETENENLAEYEKILEEATEIVTEALEEDSSTEAETMLPDDELHIDEITTEYQTEDGTSMTEPCEEESENETENEHTGEENYEMELASTYQEQTPNLENIFVDVIGDTASIFLEGNNLEGEKVCVKIVPIDNEENIAYIRQLEAEYDTVCSFEVNLSGYSSQLFKITANCGSGIGIEKLFVCGESNKLKLKRDPVGINISATANVEEKQKITVKIEDMNATTVYTRQIISNADGSYSVDASFPSINKEEEYIIFVTEEKSNMQFVQKVGIFLPESAVLQKSNTITGGLGHCGDVVIYGKNLSDTSKYIYELMYNSSELKLKYANIMGENIKILNINDGNIVFVSENRNIEGKLWSGTVNVVMFEALSENSATVTLSVYERE